MTAMKVELAILFIGASAISIARARPSDDTGYQIIPLEDEFVKATLPVPSHELDAWNDWESWDAPAKITNLDPFYQGGYDLDGLPYFVVEFGNWNYIELAKLSDDEINAFNKHFEHCVRRMSKDAAANSYQVAVLVVDWEGFKLANFESSKALGLLLKCFTASFQTNRSTKYVININTNFAAETFLNLAKPFLGELMERCELYGTRIEKWKPILFCKIPQGQLPPKYGGKDDWKPVQVS